MSWMDEVNDALKNETVDSGEYSRIPDGWYEVIASEVEEKKNKTSAGHHISVKMQITSDNCKGRLHWENYNIDNTNETTKVIAIKSFARLVQAAGFDAISDLSELNDKCFMVKFGPKSSDPSRNTIKAYSSLGGTSDLEADVPKAEENTATKKSAPWKK